MNTKNPKFLPYVVTHQDPWNLGKETVKDPHPKRGQGYKKENPIR